MLPRAAHHSSIDSFEHHYSSDDNDRRAGDSKEGQNDRDGDSNISRDNRHTDPGSGQVIGMKYRQSCESSTRSHETNSSTDTMNQLHLDEEK
uniref:Uncharacterized protein n=1 Tax=Ascaris lumbricoides TaxID=6252 RepID=A0A0M3I7J5_ASCLU